MLLLFFINLINLYLPSVLRIIVGIEPAKGTKMQRTNYKQPLSERLQTLLDKHATWLTRNENEEEDELNEEDVDNP